MNKPKVLIAHPGTQHSHYLAIQLHNNGYLLKFHTGIAFGSNHIISRLASFLPKIIRNQIRGRIIAELPDEKIKRNIFNEIKSLYKINQGNNEEEVFHIRNKEFQESISKIELQLADIVIGYDTSSWILARRCKDLGIPFILDVSIGHPLSKNIISNALRKKYPDWETQIQIKNKELIEYETIENSLASLIITPSHFVKNSFIENHVEENKIKVNPFGTDTSYFIFHQKKQKKKIKFLFFGGLTARKGLPLLLSVWKKNTFLDAELTIAGFGELPNKLKLPNSVLNKGKVALEERMELFKEHDIFIFPSNFEGFAQVQIEAVASGLPLISTPNAGGEEIISNGFNGLLIKPESEIELEQAINFFINNPEKIAEMSRNQKHKINNFTWDAYGKRWINILDEITLNIC